VVEKLRRRKDLNQLRVGRYQCPSECVIDVLFGSCDLTGAEP